MTKRMTISHGGHHLEIQRSDNPQQRKWLATVREYPMLWCSDESFAETLAGMVKRINEIISYRELHPKDLGRFRP
jgi:hypothetical protein